MNSSSLKKQKKNMKFYGSMGFVVVIFFILKYHFQFHVTAFHIYFIPSGLLIPLGIFLENKIRYPFIPAFLGYLGGSLVLTISSYACGGFKSPGIFWYAILPLIGGILMGRKGVWIGGANLVLALTFFYFCEKFSTLPNVLVRLGIYDEEVKINMLILAVFSLLVTRRYFNAAEASRIEQTGQHQQIDDLLKVLIHDVASPFSTIEIWASQIESMAEDKEIQRLNQSILRQTTNMTSVLSSIREFRAVVDGKKVLQKHFLSLKNLIADAIESMNAKCEIKNVEIIVTELPDPDVVVETDEILFKTVILTNILSNAIKFSPVGGKIMIRVKQPNSGSVEVTVEDCGIGIPASILAGIFEIKGATSRAGTAGESGTGYGLPLVKHYLENLGGSISISSREKNSTNNDSGSVVRISHPLKSA